MAYLDAAQIAFSRFVEKLIAQDAKERLDKIERKLDIGQGEMNLVYDFVLVRADAAEEVTQRHAVLFHTYLVQPAM